MDDRIRPATPADATDIATYAIETWRAAYAGLMPGKLLEGLDPTAEAERLRDRLATPAPRQSSWILEAGGEFAGCCTVGPVRTDGLHPALDPERVGEVQGINIRPSFWGRGLGQKLLEHGADELRRSGFQDLALWVLVGNRRAERFYAAAGFEREGPQVSKTVGGHDLPHWLLRRPLVGECEAR